MNWQPKDWVEHSFFGIGRVSEDRGDRLDIDFVNHGEKTILKSTELKAAASPIPDSTFPHTKGKSYHSKFKVERPPRRPPLDFDNLVTSFVSRFTSGFAGQDFHLAERAYKAEAAALLKHKLAKDVFQSLLREEHYAEVCSISNKVLQTTNLVFQIQKAQFKYLLVDKAAHHEPFGTKLFDLLHGSGPMEERFVAFCDMLSQANLNHWTIATYYQFLATDGEWMFMKPEVTKRMADSLNIALNYKTEPNWLTYSKLQELANRVDSELRNRGLVPHSRVDLQGFIWASIKIEKGEYGKSN
jgi:uncharacterized protein YchJ